MTPIRSLVTTLPSRFLSICVRVWLPPCGPTGTTKRPPGANCAINLRFEIKKNYLFIAYNWLCKQKQINLYFFWYILCGSAYDEKVIKFNKFKCSFLKRGKETTENKQKNRPLNEISIFTQFSWMFI